MNKKEDILFDLINRAQDFAEKTHCKHVYLEHVLYIFLNDSEVEKSLRKNRDFKYDKIMAQLENYLKHLDINSEDKLEGLDENINVLIKYYITSDKCNEHIVDNNISRHIINFLAGIIFIPSMAKDILVNNGVTFDFITDYYQNEYNEDELIDNVLNEVKNKISGFGENSTQTEGNTDDFINTYTINLNKLVSDSSWVPLIGRDYEVNLIEQVLLRKNKPNVILVGNSGIGKKKIIEGFVKKYIETNDTEIYQLDTLALMTNVGIKGILENRIKVLCDILKNKKAILFIEDIGQLCNTDSNNSIDIASLIRPLMEDSSFKIIGTSTFEDYRKYLEKDTNFSEKFNNITIEDPTLDNVKDILENIKVYYETFYKIKYKKETINTIIQLSNRYIFDKHFPDKAIDIMDMVGAYCKYNNIKTVNDDNVKKIISEYYKIPLDSLTFDETTIYNHLENKLSEKIIGQEEAVKKVVDAVIVSKVGLRESNKTAISLMFQGQPGSGKTELCKVLSETLNIPLIRFDMSEYVESNSCHKLLGAPPGYKDAGNGKAGNGLLINAIDEHPYCILLLDEIEKAHPNIHNVLLQVMDNGKLTSSMGKSVSFENVFLIMTSNVGSAYSNKIGIGFGETNHNLSLEDYQRTFVPEFRSRIDSVVIFNNLSKDVLRKICNKFLNELNDMLLKQKLKLNYNENVIEYILNNCDLNNGARPLKHYITNNIKNIIAKNIAFGKYKNKKIINLSIKNNEIDFGV